MRQLRTTRPQLSVSNAVELAFSFWMPTIVFISLTLLFTHSQAKLEVWKDLPGETYVKFYLFNVTNPDEFEDGHKPNFQQVGPFVFRENSHKINVSNSDDGTTTKFRLQKSYVFLPELSKDDETGQLISENNLINIINLPLMSFAKNLAGVPYVGANMIRSLLKAKEKVIKRNIRVGDLFYYGYEASAYLKVIDILLPGEAIPPEFEDGRFGLFKGRNGTDDGEFEIGTGTSSLHPYGHVVSWKKQSELSWWNGSACNNFHNSILDGSTGFNRVELDHYHLHVLLPDACRTIKYTYDDEVPYKNGDIVGLRYKFDKNIMKSSKEVSENTCYCMKSGEDDQGKCLKSGAIDIAPCRSGAPLALSYPHFLDADPYYLDKIKSGLNPKQSKHESFMIIEPRTGTLLQDVKRFQLNIWMKPIHQFNYFKSLPEMLFPILWTEKVYTLSDSKQLEELAKELNTLNENEELLAWKNKNSQSSPNQHQHPSTINSKDGNVKPSSSSKFVVSNSMILFIMPFLIVMNFKMLCISKM